LTCIDIYDKFYKPIDAPDRLKNIGVPIRAIFKAGGNC